MREPERSKPVARILFFGVSAISVLLAVSLAQRYNISIAQLSVCLLCAFAVVSGLVPSMLSVQLKVERLSRELEAMSNRQEH